MTGGCISGEKKKTGDSRASSKRSDSATGSPLTLSGDNMWPIMVFFTLLEKRETLKVIKYGEGKKRSAGEYVC